MQNELIEPVVGWFSLSLIISGIAQSMNRSGLGWWLFGIITGPFALFCLVAIAGKIEVGAEGGAETEIEEIE